MKWMKTFGVYTILIIFMISFTTVSSGKIWNFDTQGDPSNPKSKGSYLNYSINGDFGIRFSLVDKIRGGKVGRSVDYFKIKNKQKEGKIIHAVCGKSKIEYRKEGFSKDDFCKTKYLNGSGGYAYHEPSLWNVIYSKFGNKADRNKIKKWLSGEKQIRNLAGKMGLSPSLFDLKDHRLIIEPVFYFTLNGEHYALTAHEIALWDESLNGGIRKKHVTRSHKNIPASLYLKRDRFGVEKYRGKIGVFDNETIRNKLGMGIIGDRGGDIIGNSPKINVFDYVYRCDTEVYTTVELMAGSDSTPDNPLLVSFHIPEIGYVETKEVYVPKGYSQQVWVKWKTPKKPVEMEIKVSSNRGEEKTIKADIVERTAWEPQNPKADDIKPISLNEFRIGSRPEQSEITQMESSEEAVWSKWEVMEYHPNGDFIGWEAIPDFEYDSEGNSYIASYSYIDLWDMNPYWSFGKHSYTTSEAPDGSTVTHIVDGRMPTSPNYYKVQVNKAVMSVEPAETCVLQNPEKSYIKSGYGIKADIDIEISGNGLGEVTGFQNSRYFFPEFNYKKYWRWGERVDCDRNWNRIREKLVLPKNWYSYTGYKHYKNGRYHFLPIWYPDCNYKPYANIFDCWTPAGELKTKATGTIHCRGSLWDDWYVKVDK